MRNIAAVVLILMMATVAHAGEIFRYVDSYGVVSFTDNEKRIPAAYKDVAEKIILEGEYRLSTTFASSRSRLDLRHYAVVEADATILPDARPDTENPVSVFNEPCTGAVTVTSERRQLGDFNRTVYRVHDECGNLVSETFSQPKVSIER